jgi:hypothetical protein
MPRSGISSRMEATGESPMDWIYTLASVTAAKTGRADPTHLRIWSTPVEAETTGADALDSASRTRSWTAVHILWITRENLHAATPQHGNVDDDRYSWSSEYASKLKIRAHTHSVLSKAMYFGEIVMSGRNDWGKIKKGRGGIKAYLFVGRRINGSKKR